MHQQTTKTKRFENLLNWCQGQVREIEFILDDAYLYWAIKSKRQ